MKTLPIFLILLLLCACKTHRNTATEYIYLHDTDTVRELSIRLDSIVISDSVIIFQRGDTIYKEKYHTEVKERVRTDTVTKIVTQKLYFTKTEEKTVEVNRLKGWQKALMVCGICGIVMAVGMLIRFIRKFFK